MIAALFGHKDTPADVEPVLEKTLRRLTEENDEITFLVGTHGRFDRMAQSALEKLAKSYPNMRYYIVLSRYPTKTDNEIYAGLPTTLPGDFEKAIPRFSISFRNNWMVREADMVVCYIAYERGGAAQFVARARRKGKTVVNLAEKV